MNIVLKPELEKFIEEQVRSGHYDTAADAINAAVAQLQADRGFAALPLDELRAEIDAGLAEADRGEFVEYTAEDVIAERWAAMALRQPKGR